MESSKIEVDSNAYILIMLLLLMIIMGYSRNNPNSGAWGYGIPRGIKEIACGIFRG